MANKRKTAKKGSQTAPAAKKNTMTAAEKEAVEAVKRAKAAEKEAAKLGKAAEKEKNKAKAEARKAKEKTANEAKQKAKHTSALRELDKDAKEINVRMDKAAKLNKDADDHRLAAAIRMDEAKEECREAGIKFKGWAEENIKLSYESVRKLLPVGAAENESEGEGKLMLSDMRNKNKAANKKARDTKAASKASGDKKPAERKVPAGERAIAAIGAMKKDERTNLITSQAENLGMKVVTNAEAKKAKAGKGKSTRELAEAAFEELGGKAKVAFTNWAAEQIGATIDLDSADAGDSGDADGGDGSLDIPPHLDRNKKRKKRSRRS